MAEKEFKVSNLKKIFVTHEDPKFQLRNRKIMCTKKPPRKFIGIVIFFSLVLALTIICLKELSSIYMPSLRQAYRAERSSGSFCKVHFMAAGQLYKYDLSRLSIWLKKTDPHCSLEILHERSSVLSSVPFIYKKALKETMKIPVIAADLMKLLTIVFEGGLVADFDVEPLAQYPSAWFNTPRFFTCDVVFGMEHSCFEGDCINSYNRYGQLHNWAMYARYPSSPFLKELLAKMIEKIDMSLYVQEIAGSGAMTDFLIQKLGQKHWEMPCDEKNKTLQKNEDAVLKTNIGSEQICILGKDWTGTFCKGKKVCLLDHVFEGTGKG